MREILMDCPICVTKPKVLIYGLLQERIKLRPPVKEYYVIVKCPVCTNEVTYGGILASEGIDAEDFVVNKAIRKWNSTI